MLRACDEWLQARDGKDSHQKISIITASEGSRREERTLRCISLEFLTRPFMNILVAKCVTLSRLSEDISIWGCTQMSGQMPAGIHSSTRVAGLFCPWSVQRTTLLPRGVQQQVPKFGAGWSCSLKLCHLNRSLVKGDGGEKSLNIYGISRINSRL